MQNSKPSSQFLFSKAKWPIFLLANIALLLVIAVSTVRETYKVWTVDNEIDALENKIKYLEGRKIKLGELALKMQSQRYVEKEARSKLGLRKAGEHVILLEGAETTSTQIRLDIASVPNMKNENKISINNNESNPSLWWKYFTQ